MRKDMFKFKLLPCTFLLLFFGTLVSAQEVPAQDETSQREMESRELLQRMKEAPPAPMPSAAAVRPDAESASPESRSVISYDPKTGKVTRRSADAASTEAISVSGKKPEHVRNADEESDQIRKSQEPLSESIDEDTDRL